MRYWIKLLKPWDFFISIFRRKTGLYIVLDMLPLAALSIGITLAIKVNWVDVRVYLYMCSEMISMVFYYPCLIIP